MIPLIHLGFKAQFGPVHIPTEKTKKLRSSLLVNMKTSGKFCKDKYMYVTFLADFGGQDKVQGLH